MFKFTPNLEQEGRYTRYFIGGILIIAGILGLGRIFLILCGLVLVAQGVLAWGLVPILMEKFLKTPPQNPNHK
ncbi:MAG: hypothetical protein ACD_44C00201G0013 [uncultured bacterium]|nr:MAG: hypothetical protein ACD_44C00201G0013 [uncultured bacterium]OGT16179.1 MAG: hypothetical protein A3B69_00750 [Gammaproteobacteria bacterium RIFCSPHIGHO2_02_FULL_38_33]OGT23488.1 MAG: hypothetical protein A2W47_05720 [Gammaproteobacteria bacterium RIFCSPHIGHO2_12_38_15]OGT69596.1 MAG: hypothetical protein A3I12_03085 [Gammaproteobacteria bacterium RIFCSPLOWO2_02_FULL_38_11]OGT75443.1 MAG: hypothetical protein A3G71_06335 [Gammaproteobacteria bacterium RIFCSPLOWO2_12_FULL_38_14]